MTQEVLDFGLASVLIVNAIKFKLVLPVGLWRTSSIVTAVVTDCADSNGRRWVSMLLISGLKKKNVFVESALNSKNFTFHFLFWSPRLQEHQLGWADSDLPIRQKAKFLVNAESPHRLDDIWQELETRLKSSTCSTPVPVTCEQRIFNNVNLCL
jgi:hypothetical protein